MGKTGLGFTALSVDVPSTPNSVYFTFVRAPLKLPSPSPLIAPSGLESKSGSLPQPSKPPGQTLAYLEIHLPPTAQEGKSTYGSNYL